MDGNTGASAPNNAPKKDPASLRTLLGRTNQDWLSVISVVRSAFTAA